jgi:hypothetical protein
VLRQQDEYERMMVTAMTFPPECKYYELHTSVCKLILSSGAHHRGHRQQRRDAP